MNMITLWFVLFIVFLVAEIITAGALVSVWFCVGSLVALGAAYFNGNILLQVVLFLIVSIFLLLITKPLIKRYIKPKKSATNADRILNMRGIVKEEINNLKGVGSITVDGKTWTARSILDEVIIPKNTEVIVFRIEGVKAMVKLGDEK